ncbi:MAG: iron complex outermembrane receptor protein [Porticoccus sp.]|jgi:iron complex outermembrane receptor protein
MTSSVIKFTSMKKFGRNTMAAAVGLAVLSPAAVMAQGLMLEEVLVTAQKREERAMDVPIAIGTFTPQNIADTGALSIQDIDNFIPGFESSDSSFTQNTLTIRGITTPSISTGGDPSVATFYDDAYVPSAASTVQFSDVASIEILKGPQGTLFGRNAAAGVVSIQPNKPSAEADGFVSARVGNYGLKRVEGMVNVPVTDSLFLRANIMKNERDGYIENTVPGGSDPEEQDVTAGRLAILWEASEATTLQFSFDFDDIDNGAQQAIGVTVNDANGDPQYNGKDAFDQKVQHDVQGESEARTNYAYNAKLFHDINDVLSMKVVASYREWETYNLQDEDGFANVDVFVNTNNIEDSDIFYSEVQFNYTGDDITAVFGANYSQEDVYQNTQLNFNSDTVNAFLGAAVFPLGEASSENIENTGDFENYGVYGDLTYDLGDRWTFSAGARYSHDEKEFTWLIPDNSYAPLYGAVGNQFFLQYLTDFPTVNTAPVKGSESWSKVTGRALAKYQINDDVMTYLSYSTGYKSGGYSSLSVYTANEPLEPEETSNIEWGIKGEFFDNSLRTQLSVFKLDVDDRAEQIDAILPGSTVAIPTLFASDLTVEGVELVIDWLATDDLKLGLATTVRDDEETIEDFYDDTGALVLSETKDKEVAAEYTVMLDWAPEVEFGGILLHVDYQYREDIQDDEQGFNPIFLTVPGFDEAFKSLNARLAWTNTEDNLTVAIWGQNITDEERIKGTGTTVLNLFGAGHVNVDPPRTYGVDVKYSF